MQPVFDDLRYALRQLRKSPGFTITAVLTLALGIGATTAIFTLVYDVMLRPLPYSHAEQLIVMEEQVAEFRDLYPTLPMNANHFFFWQQHSQSFQSMAMMEEDSWPLGLAARPIQLGVLKATPGIFSVLDSAPVLGRAFSQQEAQQGHERVVVLMHNFWRTQFQSDPAILGKTVTLNGFPYTVIGVMAAVIPPAPDKNFGRSECRSSATRRSVSPDGLFAGQFAASDGRFRLLRAGSSEARSFSGSGQR